MRLRRGLNGYDVIVTPSAHHSKWRRLPPQEFNSEQSRKRKQHSRGASPQRLGPVLGGSARPSCRVCAEPVRLEGEDNGERVEVFPNQQVFLHPSCLNDLCETTTFCQYEGCHEYVGPIPCIWDKDGPTSKPAIVCNYCYLHKVDQRKAGMAFRFLVFASRLVRSILLSTHFHRARR